MSSSRHFRGHKQSDVREHNVLTLLRLIRDSGPVSRSDLVELTGLSKATVSILIRDLEETGIIVPVGPGTSAVGPKPRLIGFRGDFRHVIGIDFSDTHYIAALVDLNGRIACEPIYGDVAKGEKGLLATVSHIVGELKQVATQHGYSLCGIGIALSGLINSDRGIVHSSTVFDVTDMPLQDELERRFQLPVRIDGDVNVRLVAEEAEDEVGWALRNVIYVYVGTGVGAGIYLNDEIYRGTSGLVGEVGHIPVEGDGPKCACGRSGCLEAVASWPMLASMATEAGFDPGSHKGPRDPEEGAPRGLTSDDVARAAEAGDPLALAACNRLANYLAEGLATLANVLNPDLIILGGKIDAYPGLFYPLLRQGLNQKALPPVASQVELRIAKAGPLAGVKGTAGLLFPVVMSRLLLT